MVFPEKTALRKDLLAMRKAFSAHGGQYAAASLRAQQNLMRLPVWKTALRVALYMPVRGETDTAVLAAALAKQGRSALFPRCTQDSRGKKLEFAVCRGPEDLRQGAFGIAEPDPARCPATDKPPDLLVVPAVGLDRQGYRLGYGGGYYDRLLAEPDWEQIPAVGLIFSFQLVNTLPRATWDKPLAGVVTDEDYIWLSM